MLKLQPRVVSSTPLSSIPLRSGLLLVFWLAANVPICHAFPKIASRLRNTISRRAAERSSGTVAARGVVPRPERRVEVDAVLNIGAARLDVHAVDVMLWPAAQAQTGSP